MTARSRGRRAAAWLLLVAALAQAALLVVVGAAAPASAHATLISTDPAEGAVRETAPDHGTIMFKQ